MSSKGFTSELCQVPHLKKIDYVVLNAGVLIYPNVSHLSELVKG